MGVVFKVMEVEQVDAAQVLKTLPDVTKVLLGLLVAGAAFNALGFSKFLMMIPNSTVGEFQIWTLITYAFVEKGLVPLVLSLLTTSTIGRIAEPMWGSTEFALFIGVVVLASGVVSWITCYIMFQNTGDAAHLLVEISGFQAGVGALLVAVKLLAGDQDVGGLRAKWLPSLYFLACAALVCFISSYSAYLGMLGVCFGWIYLRFWQRDSENRGGGHTSPSFTFATFFPEVMQPAATVFGTVVFNIAALCHLVKKRLPADPADQAEKFYSKEVSSLGTNPAIAERRRQQAQQELEARLAQVEKNQDADDFDSLLDSVEAGEAKET